MSENIHQEIGASIKYIRLLHKMSTQQLADILGCPEDQIERYETAKDAISAADVFLLASFLLVPVEKFFPNHQNEDLPPDEALGQDAYSILKSFSEIENPHSRKQILGLCRMYNEFDQKSILDKLNDDT